jgi:hypothetical protein
LARSFVSIHVQVIVLGMLVMLFVVGFRTPERDPA